MTGSKLVVVTCLNFGFRHLGFAGEKKAQTLRLMSSRSKARFQNVILILT